MCSFHQRIPSSGKKSSYWERNRQKQASFCPRVIITDRSVEAAVCSTAGFGAY
jgi:hypothetical protein